MTTGAAEASQRPREARIPHARARDGGRRAAPQAEVAQAAGRAAGRLAAAAVSSLSGAASERVFATTQNHTYLLK
jgi:hypothetical protein